MAARNFALELIADYLNTLPHDAAKLADAIEQKSHADIRFLTYKLKGASRFISYNDMADMVEKNDLLFEHGDEQAARDNIHEILRYPLQQLLNSKQSRKSFLLHNLWLI